MNPIIKKISFSFLQFAGMFFLSGCNNIFTGDPTLDNETSDWVNTPWKPTQRQWPCRQQECPEKAIPDPEMILNLADMVDIALNNNPRTSKSWSQARASAFGYWASQSSWYPLAIVSGDLIYEDNLGLGAISSTSTVPAAGGVAPAVVQTSVLAPNKTWSTTTDLSISYLLLDFGGRCANIVSARQALYASNWTHNRVLQSVMLSVLENYYLHVSAKELYKAQQEDLKDSQVNLEAAKALFQAGIVTRVDVLQAQSNLVNTELALVSTQGRINTTYSALATALGLEPTVKFTVQELPEKIPFEDIDKDIERLMEISKTQRPDLAAAYALFLQSKAEYAKIVSESLPTVNVLGDMQEINFLKYTKLNGHSYTGALNLSFPLFAGGYYRNSIKEAQENMDVAASNFDDLENAILLDVSTSYYNYVTAVKSISFSEEYLKFAQDAYDLSIATYKGGTGTWLDVLSAQKTLAEARAQRIKSLTEWAISLTNIAYTTGTLYQGGV